MTDHRLWYEHEDSEDASRAVGEFFSAIESWRDCWLAQHEALVALYERALWQRPRVGSTVTGEPTTFFQYLIDRGGGYVEPPPSHNLAKTAVDVLAARLFAEAPRLDVIVDGGDYVKQLQARRKTWALRATLDTMPCRQALLQFYRDGLQTGFGALEPVVRGGSFTLDRVLLEELYWHPEEARTQRTPSSPPRTMHRVQRIGRGQVLAMIDKFDVSKSARASLRDRVESMRMRWRDTSVSGMGPTSDYDRVSMTAASAHSDMLHLVRSIRLPSDIDSDDGRELLHVRAGDSDRGVVLWDGPWKRETLPWVWWTPYPASLGLIGQGVGHVARPYQCQIDQAWPRIERILQQFGLPKVAYAPGAEEQLDAIDSPDMVYVRMPTEIGAAMRSAGKPYEVITHDAASGQLLAHPGNVAAAMFAALGINEGVALGGSALGANASGAALNAEDTRADVRFADVLLQADAAHVAMGVETLNALDDAMERDPDFRVRFSDAWGGAEQELWSELKLGTGSYTVRLEQTGALGRTPAARIRAIQEMGQLGMVDPSTAARAVYRDKDQTDIEEIATSDALAVEWSLYYLVLHAEKSAEDIARYWPDETTDLDIAERRSRAEISKAKRQRAPDAVMDALITYRAQVQALRAQHQAALQPPAPAMPMGAETMPGGMAELGEMPDEMSAALPM